MLIFYLISKKVLIVLTFCIHMEYISIATQDQTSTRANTLLDNADDIQKQLDNESRERMAKPTTVWVLHMPAHVQELNNRFFTTRRYFYEPKKLKTSRTLYKKGIEDWNYKEQRKWHIKYRECGGYSQSPVDMPNEGLIKATARKMVFENYNKRPKSLYISNDGSRLRLFGDWDQKDRPIVYGGAAHNRRYIFHSITLHWPSEHSVGGLQYPLESQVLHISADYRTLNEAINASKKDRLAFLCIVNLYMYKNYTDCSIESILLNGVKTGFKSTINSYPLRHFNLPLKAYASYHGSLTVPPCSEAVLWLVRDQTLPITREAARAFQALLIEDFKGSLRREIQPMNDRKVYLFK